MMQVSIVVMAADWQAVGDGSALLCAGIWFLLLTLFVGLNFADRAVTQGYRPTWGLLAVLSFAGLAVVYSLPDQTPQPPGFPVQPLEESQ
jgi:hypothetical protein